MQFAFICPAASKNAIHLYSNIYNYVPHYLGIIVLIAGFAVRHVDNVGRYAGTIRLVGMLIIAIGISISCFVQVGPGQVGVKKLFGKIQPMYWKVVYIL
jgi:hypothetical protein